MPILMSLYNLNLYFPMELENVSCEFLQVSRTSDYPLKNSGHDKSTKCLIMVWMKGSVGLALI